MLFAFQVIALVQGIFLLWVLLHSRKKYRQVPFIWLSATILSVVLFLLGDDENNLLFPGVNLFIFDCSLFITCFFLFFRYLRNGWVRFRKADLFFFLPNLVFLVLEKGETPGAEEGVWLSILEFATETAFAGYLIHIIRYSLIGGVRHWVFYVALPIVFLLGIPSVTDLGEVLGLGVNWPVDIPELTVYMPLLLAFLFYFMTFQLLRNPNGFLPRNGGRYPNSNLTPELIERCRTALRRAMETDRLYLKPDLSIHGLSEAVGLPRRYVSEVLNRHIGQKFQDYVNMYRLKAFLGYLEEDRYAHLTLFGVASEAGFSSKTTFNAFFKRQTGETPQVYRQRLLSQRATRPD